MKKRTIIIGIFVSIGVFCLFLIGSSIKSGNSIIEKHILVEEDFQKEELISAVEANGYEVTVNMIGFTDSKENLTSSKGKQFVLINISVTNHSDQMESVRLQDFSLEVDGVKSETDFISVDGIASLSNCDLEPEESTSGKLISEVPTEAPLVLVYETKTSFGEIGAEFAIR